MDRFDSLVRICTTGRAIHLLTAALSLVCGAWLAHLGGVTLSWHAAALVPLTLLLHWACQRAPQQYWRWRARQQPASAAPPDTLACVAAELVEVAPYLDLLKQQLAGSLAVTEEGMLGLIGSLNAIHTMSHEQVGRIKAAELNGAELSAVVNEKIMVDEQMVSILELFVTRQEQDIASNLSRMHRLQEVKSLEPMIEVITEVAQQTNLMSINAAILAAHAGEQGRAFGVLATAIRELSQRTAATARDIGKKIRAATADLDQEVQAVHRVGERQSAIGNMRKVVADIKGMQGRFAGASQRLLEILEWDKSGHSHLVKHMSEAMGQVQVQDILRQRVEHVEAALTELQEHMQALALRMGDRVWDNTGLVGLRDRLQAHLDSYVMQSQRLAHQQILGGGAAAGEGSQGGQGDAGGSAGAVSEEPQRPAIELF